MLKLEGPVAIAGDWHAQTRYAAKAIRYSVENGAKSIIHVGDFGLMSPNDMDSLGSLLEELDINIYWVDGNHENHDYLATLHHDPNTGLAETGPNMYHMKRGTLFTVGGCRWLGLGGTSSIDRAWRTPGHSWWEKELITFADLEIAARHGIVEVMVTHEAPEGSNVLKRLADSSAHMWPEEDIKISEQQRYMLSMAVRRAKPKVLFHGHWHVRYSEQISVSDHTLQLEGLDRDGSELFYNILVVDGSGNILS